MAGMRRSVISVAVLAAALPGDGSVPTEFRLFPAGRFAAADGSGRPEGVPGWLMTEAIAKRLIAAAKARQSDYVIDYEHQTLHAEKNGQPAPASGWLRDPEWRPDGLYIKVDWTDDAAAMIAARKYRYVSPVFGWDKKTGEIKSIYHAALTNHPGLDGLTDLSALTAHFEEEPPMKELLKALGLAETATEAEALTALAALKATHGTEVAALKAVSPDPAKYVEVTAMTALQGELATTRTELAALKAETQKGEVDKVVTDALTAGKLTPATEKWARDLGATNLAALKSYVEAAPVVAKPGATQTNGAAPAGGTPHQSTDVDVAVMKALGLTADQFATGKKEA